MDPTGLSCEELGIFTVYSGGSYKHYDTNGNLIAWNEAGLGDAGLLDPIDLLFGAAIARNVIRSLTAKSQSLPQVVVNRLKGMDFEGYVLSLIGKAKNTAKVDGYVPDILEDAIIAEIKRVRRIYNTKQLKAFMKHAEDNGKQFYLYLEKGYTQHFSKPFLEKLEEVGGEVKYINK